MKKYKSLEQGAAVSHDVAFHEEIALNHAYAGSGLSTSDVLRLIEDDDRLLREIQSAVSDRLIEE